MANATADQSLVDKLARAHDELSSRTIIKVTDTTTDFRALNTDGGVAPLYSTLTVKTSSRALMVALVAAIEATGRPA